MAEVVTEMERGTPPSDPKAKALAQRWMQLVSAFTGEREDISQSLKAGFEQQMDDETRRVWAYITQALQ